LASSWGLPADTLYINSQHFGLSMTVLACVFLWAPHLIQAGTLPHSKVMRTQMDVDHTGRVHQRRHVQEEENEHALEHGDEDEETGLGKPINAAFTSMKQAFKEGDTILANIGEEVIRSAASIPFQSINTKGTLLQKAEDGLQEAVAYGVSQASAPGNVMDKVANVAVEVQKQVMAGVTSKDGNIVDKIKEALPFGKDSAIDANNVAGMHVPKIIKDVQENIGMHVPKLFKDVQESITGDMGKVLADVQGHVAEDALKGAMNEVMKVVAPHKEVQTKDEDSPSILGKELQGIIDEMVNSR